MCLTKYIYNELNIECQSVKCHTILWVNVVVVVLHWSAEKIAVHSQMWHQINSRESEQQASMHLDIVGT